MATSENCGYTFTWIIENIDYFAQGSKLESSKFVANCLYKTEWNLNLNSLPSIENGKIVKILGLTKRATEPYNIDADFEFSLFDSKNEKLHSYAFRNFFFHRGNADTGKYGFREIDKYFSKLRTVRCRLWTKETVGIIEQGFCQTNLIVERRYFTFVIENFRQLSEEGKLTFISINSKKYPSKNIDLVLNISRKSAGKLHVELKNNFVCVENRCSFHDSCRPYPFVHDCEISILDYKGNALVFPNKEKWKIATSDDRYELRVVPKCRSHDKYYFQFPTNTENAKLEELFSPTHSVSFQCACEICFGFETNLLEDVHGVSKENIETNENKQDRCKSVTSLETSTSNFMKDMLQLSSEKQFCDFNLKTETEVFPIHRAILSVRSPVFKAMFSHDMKESSNQSVDIPDLNAATVRRMLVYIYTDNVGDIMWKEAYDLYIAGDKYQLFDLKERCAAILKSSLQPSNVCEIVVLADERHDQNLKRVAIDYIVDNDTEIIHLDAWKIIEKKNPNLGIDILRQIVNKRQGI